MDKFAHALSTEDTVVDKNIYFEFQSKETSCMFKKASVVSMKEPTVEKIKSYVLERLQSDLGSSKADIKVAIKVLSSQDDNVVNAEGSANIKIGKQLVVVPFKVNNGEISDFTELRVGKESIIYNKQSLAKLTRASEDEDSNNSFIGTAKYDNSTTDTGFLDDVIKIRDSHMGKQVNATPGGRYLTASEACNEMLEKSCNIKPVNENTFLAVENIVRQKVASTVQNRMEKIASIDIDKKISHAEEVLDRIRELPLKSVHAMKHGQKILFPEINGDEISMTPGVVFRNIDKEYYKANTYSDINSLYSTIISANDGRIALLGSGDAMLALEDDSLKFKLPVTRLKAIDCNETYFAVVDNKIVAPFCVTDRVGDNYVPNAMADVVNELEELIGVDKPIVQCKPAFVEGASYIPTLDIIMIPGQKFTCNIKKVRVGGNTRYVNGVSDILKKALSHNHNLFSSITSLCNMDGAIVADPESKIVKVKGLIKGYISNKKELNPNVNRSADLIKVAACDTLRIEKVAEDKYSARVTGKHEKNIGKKLDKKEVQTVMLSMGYTPQEVGETMHSLRESGRAYKQTPLNTNVNKLYNGEVESKTKSIMNKVKQSVFNKEKAKEATRDFTINMTSGVLGDIASETESVYSMLEYLSKFANESKAASIMFEKLAMEYKNEDLQNVSKVMLTANNMFNIVSNAVKGSEFNMFKEACESITSNKDTLEELSTGLCRLSNDQFETSDEYVPFESIRTASEVIGALFELSKTAAFQTNQDVICIKCGAKPEEPLMHGKCKACMDEELKSVDEDGNAKKDDNEIKGDVGEEDK